MTLPEPEPKLFVPPPLLVASLVGVAQGLALWWLFPSSDEERLPLAWRAFLVTLALLGPFAVTFLSAFVTRTVPLNVGMAGVTVLTALLAAANASNFTVNVVLFALSSVVLVHASVLSNRVIPAYPTVWRSVTSNVALFAGASVFTAAFGFIFALSAELFEAVGFEGVARVLGDPLVSYPLFGAAFAVGVTLLRGGRWLDGVSSALVTALGWLAPVGLLVTSLFALSLPAAGLTNSERLFEGLLSSYLYVSLTVGVLLLVSAAHGSGTDGTSFPAWLKRFVRFALFALPLFPALALYGLSRRVLAYGLTEERVLGVALSAVLFVVAVGYATRPPLKGDGPERLGSVNTLGLALLALVSLLLSVPGLRPVDVAVRSQAARIVNAGTAAAERALSIRYLAYETGEAGRGALRRLSNLPSEARAQVAFALTRTWSAYSTRYVDRRAVDVGPARLVALGEDDALSPAARRSLLRSLRRLPGWRQLCFGASPACDAHYAVVRRNDETLALLFFNTNRIGGVYFEVFEDRVEYGGRVTPSFEPNPTRPVDVRGEARGGVRAETLRVDAVRVGDLVVFLRQRP